MKDTKTILLALLSLGLVTTWVYHLYDKTKYAAPAKQTETNNTELALKKVQDSLQRIYSLTLNNLGYQLDSAKNTAGLLQGELMARLDEINLLRTEIADLLRKNNRKREDLDLAGKKTAEFQQLVAELPKKSKAVSEEKKLSSSFSNEINSPAENNTQGDERLSSTPLFTATDLKFMPISVSDDKEIETNEAENTSKLVISFAVKNNATGFNNAEIYAIITQPDGKVMQTDVWESAYISTHDFGKKIYTRKVKFEYQKGETKHLQLTLKPEDYEKGNYRLQVFHNGYLIGETIKTLN